MYRTKGSSRIIEVLDNYCVVTGMAAKASMAAAFSSGVL